MEFVNFVLKLKFEKLSAPNSGFFDVSEKALWKEVVKQNIPKSDWKRFILEVQNARKHKKKESKNISKTFKNYK